MKKIRYLIPSMIIVIILLSIFYVNRLYPFGTESIVQVDADYQYIPLFYKISHFKKRYNCNALLNFIILPKLTQFHFLYFLS